MRGEWSPEELVESWTLLGDDWERVGNKSGATRLGFAVLLKFFELEAHFPRTAGDVPSAVVEYVAEQVRVPAAGFAEYWGAARAIRPVRNNGTESGGKRLRWPVGTLTRRACRVPHG